MQRLSFAYHDSRGTADSIYRIQNDTYSFQWILLHALTPLFNALSARRLPVDQTAAADYFA